MMFWRILVLIACLLSVNTQLVNDIRSDVEYLHELGQTTLLLRYLLEAEKHFGTLRIDSQLPSLYSYKALALLDSQMIGDAIVAAREAVDHHPRDTRSWLSLGELQLQAYCARDALHSFMTAYDLGDNQALLKILLTNGYMAHWKDWEVTCHAAENIAMKCLRDPNCPLSSAFGLQYTDISRSVMLQLDKRSPMFPPSDTTVSSHSVVDGALQRWTQPHLWNSRKLRVGIVSADYGPHPVAQMISGLVRQLSVPDSQLELVCFGLHALPDPDVSHSVNETVWLSSLNSIDAAVLIASHHIDILIDLNGLTVHSGLPIFAHRPAPLQVSFLGFPTSTAAPYMDYFLADPVALPAELRGHFSEHLLLLPLCYLVNDYAQSHPAVAAASATGASSSSASRASVEVWKVVPPPAPHAAIVHQSLLRLRRSSLLLGSFAVASKMDPLLLQVWVNILRMHPSACLLITGYRHPAHMIEGYSNLMDTVRYHGVHAPSVMMVEISEWKDHLRDKSSLDLVLDSRLKSGHSTGLDGLWAGVPTLTFGGGISVEGRAGESMVSLRGLQSEWGVAYSLKEYEDLAGQLDKDRRAVKYHWLHTGSKHTAAGVRARGSHLLDVWRAYAGLRRMTSSLFDTRRWARTFTRLMQASWEVFLLCDRDCSACEGKKYHVFQVSGSHPNSSKSVHSADK